MFSVLLYIVCCSVFSVEDVDKRRDFLVQSCLSQDAWTASKIGLQGLLRFQHQAVEQVDGVEETRDDTS